MTKIEVSFGVLFDSTTFRPSVIRKAWAELHENRLRMYFDGLYGYTSNGDMEFVKLSATLQSTDVKKAIHSGQSYYLVLRKRLTYEACSPLSSAGNPTAPADPYECHEVLNLYVANNLVLKLDTESARFGLQLATFLRWKPIPKQVFVVRVPVDLDWVYRLDWEVQYSLFVLITHSLISLSDLNAELQTAIEEAPACSQVLDQFYWAKVKWSGPQFQQRLNRVTSLEPARPQYVKTRRVCITPSTLVFEPLESELGNRVLRKFRRYSDRFLRAKLVDEQLSNGNWSNAELVTERFRRLLTQVRIGTRSFSFLGVSGSQMRAHSCWLFHSQPDLPISQVLDSLGSFSHIRSPAKYAARLGLCFSSTHSTITLDPSEIYKIEDIERNGYTFSDGIGKISSCVLDKVKRAMNIQESVCALQVRIGGYKGVLALDPTLENGIAVRPSMHKFFSNDSVLEVCTTNGYKPAFLNQQIISLLSALGVPNQVFLELQDARLREMGCMLQLEKSAIKFLSHSAYNKVVERAIGMLKAGVQIDNEPHLKLLLVECYKKQNAEAASGTKLPAPQSALLMGVLDEYKVLKHGQVYVCINKVSPRVITGPVVVAKNPCLHPGDIRVLEAVERAELAHLSNVLVFPQEGDRPHPNECSGSDLDGDLYFVSWNPALMPTCRNFPAMDYTTTPSPIQTSITSQDLVDFFISFVQLNNIGLIADTHTALSDSTSAFAEGPLELAALHSLAVDFAKTGVPAVIPQRLLPQKYPHFMQKRGCISYTSKKVLGQLHSARYDQSPFEKATVQVNPKFVCEYSQECLAYAEYMHAMYTKRMGELQRLFNCQNEYSVLIQHLAPDSDRKEVFRLKEKCRSSCVQLEQQIWRLFRAFHGERKELASALYYTAYSHQKNLALPWVFFQYLLAK